MSIQLMKDFSELGVALFIFIVIINVVSLYLSPDWEGQLWIRRPEREGMRKEL